MNYRPGCLDAWVRFLGTGIFLACLVLAALGLWVAALVALGVVAVVGAARRRSR